MRPELRHVRYRGAAGVNVSVDAFAQSDLILKNCPMKLSVLSVDGDCSATVALGWSLWDACSEMAVLGTVAIHRTRNDGSSGTILAVLETVVLR